MRLCAAVLPGCGDSRAAAFAKLLIPKAVDKLWKSSGLAVSGINTRCCGYGRSVSCGKYAKKVLLNLLCISISY